MSDLLDRAPTASLAVAVGLLVAAVGARALLLWADDAGVRRTARLYLEPLCVWCLIAVVVHGVALGAAGTASVGSIALLLVVAAAAVALQAGDENASPGDEPAAPPATSPPAPAAPPPPEASSRAGSLWSR
jgi:hypothetical protein